MNDGDGLLATLELNQRLAEIRRGDFRHLDNRPISMQMASQRYGVPYRTLYRWVQRGYIRVLARGPRRALLLDEGDLAFVASVYRVRQESGTLGGAPLLVRRDGEWIPRLLQHPFRRSTVLPVHQGRKDEGGRSRSREEK